MSSARPVFETTADLNREKEFVRLLETAWRCDAKKWPIRYQVDFGFYRHGRLVATAELKCRTIAQNKYPEYMIALSKWLAARELADATGKPCLLCVRWSDQDGYINLGECPTLEIGYACRADREPWDEEPVVFIPVALFRPIGPNAKDIAKPEKTLRKGGNHARKRS